MIGPGKAKAKTGWKISNIKYCMCSSHRHNARVLSKYKFDMALARKKNFANCLATCDCNFELQEILSHRMLLPTHCRSVTEYGIVTVSFTTSLCSQLIHHSIHPISQSLTS